jgi:hypothetical protein
MNMIRVVSGIALLCAMPHFAMAQAVVPDTTVDIPVSSWLNAAAELIGPMLGVAVLWLIRKLPAQLGGVLMTLRADQLLEKAISYAINAVAGATKDKPLSINVGNEVVAKAVQYVVDNGPGWMVTWLGGKDAIRQKVIARITVDPAAAFK